MSKFFFEEIPHSVKQFKENPSSVLGKIKDLRIKLMRGNLDFETTFDDVQNCIYLCYVLLNLHENLHLSPETVDKLQTSFTMLYASGDENIKMPLSSWCGYISIHPQRYLDGETYQKLQRMIGSLMENSSFDEPKN